MKRTLLFLAVLAFALAPATSSLAQTPDDLMADLYKALQGQPHTSWGAYHDLDFSSWRNGGSQNLPVIAAAIELVDSPTSTTWLNWWNSFLDCQTTPASCNVTDPRSLAYLKGKELLSSNYDWASTVSVVAVHHVATTNNNTALANKARLYLRKTWSLYALAAGRKSATDYLHDLADDAQGIPTYPQNGGNGLYWDYCQRNITTSTYWYTGPFLPLAGGRSGPATFCQDNRGPLFVRAVSWAVYPSGSYVNQRESPNQANVLNWLQSHWPGNGFNENVYALDSASQDLIENHVKESTNAATTLLSVINNGGTRFFVQYHFIAYAGGDRVTLMEESSYAIKPGNIYAAKFTESSRRAHMVYPWNAQLQNSYRIGYGKLLPTETAPTSVEARNWKTGETVSPHGDVTLTMALPSGTMRYHVELGPTFNGRFL